MTHNSPPIPTALAPQVHCSARCASCSMPVHCLKTLTGDPVAFCLANSAIGALPEELECRSWMFVEPDGSDDPVIVLAATSGNVAVYLAANLDDRLYSRPWQQRSRTGALSLWAWAGRRHLPSAVLLPF